MTRVLVTGAGGAVGRALCEHLVEIGKYEVLKTQHGTEFSEMSVGLYLLDLRDTWQVERLMEIEPDWVIHCAARWNGLNEDYSVLDDNLRMTLNLARYLPTTVSRFVYLSSSAVSRRLEGTYALGKSCEEQIVAARCRDRLGYTIWRPYHVVSPYEVYCPGRSHLVTNLAHTIINKRARLIDLRQNGRDCVRLTWVGDLVSAIVSRLEGQASDGVYDIGTTECRTIESVAAYVADWALEAGRIKAGPEILPGVRSAQPCEPYRPDVVCPTDPMEAVRRCLARRYADAPM